jgi:hypothetical protein
MNEQFENYLKQTNMSANTIASYLLQSSFMN